MLLEEMLYIKCIFLSFKVYMFCFGGVCAFSPQVLSELDITVPLQLLISMFSDGVNSVKELANQRKSRVSELSGNLAARRVIIASSCFIKMLKTLVTCTRHKSSVIKSPWKHFCITSHSINLLITSSKKSAKPGRFNVVFN